MADHAAITAVSAAQQEISNAVAGLYKQLLGRGPTKVSTVLVRDAVIVVIEQSATPYERTLLHVGATDLAHAARTQVQQLVAERLSPTIEAATGHRIRTHIPGFDASSGAATEVFLLDGQTATAQATDVTANHTTGSDAGAVR